jgi:drug/metabolite transporter (DMT)-like permease
MPASDRHSRLGPWLVALGAAMWGLENLWRVPLAGLLDHDDVLVWWEHVVLVAIALPFVLPRLGELRRVSKGALAWLVFSGLAGSALGAVLFTAALEHGNKTVVNVVLNVQPLLSTTAAVILFRDRLARDFAPWALLAVVSGMVLIGVGPGFSFSLDAGTALALLTALCWGMSTVAGRAVMVEMSLPLAAGLRVIIGLAAMTVLVAARGLLSPEHLWPAHARAHTAETIGDLLKLATISGWIPLLVYFRGLALTRASTAGYFEMMQTLAAVGVTWGVQGDALAWWQVVAACTLLGAVAMVQRVQERAGNV